jgi:hypothetical protein
MAAPPATATAVKAVARRHWFHQSRFTTGRSHWKGLLKGMESDISVGDERADRWQITDYKPMFPLMPHKPLIFLRRPMGFVTTSRFRLHVAGLLVGTPFSGVDNNDPHAELPSRAVIPARHSIQEPVAFWM